MGSQRGTGFYSIIVQLTSCIIFGIRAQRLSLTIVNMPPRRGVGIGRGRPEANEIRSLCTRMDTMETTQRRTPDEGDDSAKEESSEEEEEEENETTTVIKMLVKVG